MKTIAQVFITVLRRHATVQALNITIDGANDWLRQYEGDISSDQVQPLTTALETRGFTRQPGNDWLIIYARSTDDSALPTGTP